MVKSKGRSMAGKSAKKVVSKKSPKKLTTKKANQGTSNLISLLVVIFAVIIFIIFIKFSPFTQVNFADMGFLGVYVSKFFAILFGKGRFLFPFLMIATVFYDRHYGNDKKQLYSYLISSVVLFVAIVSWFNLKQPMGDFLSYMSIAFIGGNGGLLGGLLAFLLSQAFGIVITKLILIATGLVSVVVLFNLSLSNIFRAILDFCKDTFDYLYDKSESVADSIKQKKDNYDAKKEQAKAEITIDPKDEPKEEYSYVINMIPPKHGPVEDDMQYNGELLKGSQVDIPTLSEHIEARKKTSFAPVIESNIADNVLSKEDNISSNNDNTENYDLGPLVAANIQKDDAFIEKEYELPSTQLLNIGETVDSDAIGRNIKESVKILEDTLTSFGVSVKVTEVSYGPSITRFELEPSVGVKVSKIVSLADDIALKLAATDIRIEAPVPGKSVVGIEVPRTDTVTVSFRDILENSIFFTNPSKLCCGFGKDIAGAPVIGDLAAMPHLLIAGATGSGKSVCMNTLISSILFKGKPNEVKFIMIDPKRVELASYDGLPHMMAPVVVDPKKAAGTLKWAVREMENRYSLFAANKVKDLGSYNKMIKDEVDKIPQIVIFIDELADLMMVAAKDVEEAICRLAQMARAAGIHLVIATQRPSVDVITGLIKANIPSRIAFAVSSQIDSRTILDMGGAEKLLGKGDMLYHPVGLSKPLRVQGAFLSDEETKLLIEYCKKQGKPTYIEGIATPVEVKEINDKEEDELFLEAAKFVIASGQGSASMLQRRFRIGYNRAARLMDIMMAKGIVSPPDGAKPRTVLMSLDSLMSMYNGNESDDE